MSATRLLTLAGALLVLGAVDASIYGKERVKRDGDVVYVAIGSRDPRSLVQGDYMALRFPLAQQIEASWRSGPREAAPAEGETRYAEITLDPRGVATLAAPGANAALRIRYRVRNASAWLGTNAYFFEERTEARYAAARFAEFRLDRASGEAVLVGLRDAKLGPL
jgi:uncharacterized membrane-anchored protein